MADAQFLGAPGHDLGAAAGDDGQLDAGFLQQLDAEAVAHREALGAFTLRADPDAAVGEGAVDVHGQQAYLPGSGE